MKKYILLFSAVIFIASCNLPTSGLGSIGGTVFYESTEEQLPGVSVIYGDSAIVTDEYGAYLYENIPEGLQGIRFIKEGYHSQIKKVNIPLKGTAQCDVSMRLVSDGWAVGAVDNGYGVILFTHDGGASWLRQGKPSMLPEVDFNAVCAVDSATCWAVGNRETFRNNFVIMKTNDAGSNWENQGVSLKEYEAGDLKDIVARDKNSALCIAADTNFIFITHDGGKKWSLCGNEDIIDHYTAMTFFGKNIWCSCEDTLGMPKVNYSSDDGKNWEILDVPVNSSSYNITDICAVNENELYISGDNGMGVMYSADKGKTWSAISVLSNVGNIYSISVFDKDRIWLSTDDGKIFYTNNSFGNVTTQSAGGAAGEKVSKINMLRDGNYGAGVVSSISGLNSKIIFTTNGGNVWTYSTMPYEFEINDVDFVGGNN